MKNTLRVFSLCAAIAAASPSSAADIVVQGGRLTGTTRSELVVKTNPTKADTPAAAKVAVTTTFDTGADHFYVQPADLNALGIAGDVGMTKMYNIGGTSNLKANSVAEDTVQTVGQLNLSADKTMLASGLVSPTKLIDASTVKLKGDAYGVDALISGTVAVYDPNAKPVKPLVPARFGLTGEIAFFPALKDGKPNPDIGFNPSFKLTANLTKFGGVDPRPTFTGTLTAGAASVADKQALFDTGAPNSQISKDLIGKGAGQLDLKVENGRVIIPKVAFTSNGNTLTVLNLQASVTDRSAAVPLRIGTNVLDQFKMLIDFHQPNPPPANMTGVWGFERIPVAVGKLDPGVVRETAPVGSVVNVQYTDRTGNLLLGADNLPQQETKTVMGPADPRGLGKAEFTAPAGTADFIQSVTVPVGAGKEVTNVLTVDAFTDRAASLAGAKEVGQPDDLLAAGHDVTSIWDKIAEFRPPTGKISLPDLFDSQGRLLYEAVDLSQYLPTVQSLSELDRNWISDTFRIQDGQVFLELGGGMEELLKGFFVGLSPISADLLAGLNDPVFSNPDPATTLATAYSEHEVVPVPEPPGLALLAVGGLGAAGYFRRRRPSGRPRLRAA